LLACRAPPYAGTISERGNWSACRTSCNRVFIDRALAELPALPRPVCEVGHVSTLIGLAEAELGAANVQQLTVPRRPATVVGIPLEPPVTRTIGLIGRTGRTLLRAAHAFAKLLRVGTGRKRRGRRRRAAIPAGNGIR
jgi:DNA-binding transcriptional LysR family regulator